MINKIKHWWNLRNRESFPGGVILYCLCGYSREVLYDRESFCCPDCGEKLIVRTQKQFMAVQLYKFKYYVYTTTYASNEVFLK